MSSLVTLRYGPYESCGVINHKTFRLEGLQAVLRDCGYVCVLEETVDWNQVELVVHGESVYQCDINNLEFGGDGRLDPLCQEAIKALIVDFACAEDDPLHSPWDFRCRTLICSLKMIKLISPNPDLYILIPGVISSKLERASGSLSKDLGVKIIS